MNDKEMDYNEKYENLIQQLISDKEQEITNLKFDLAMQKINTIITEEFMSIGRMTFNKNGLCQRSRSCN